MKEKIPTYRVEIGNRGTPPNETCGWNIYKNMDVLPILRSQQFFVPPVLRVISLDAYSIE